MESPLPLFTPSPQTKAATTAQPPAAAAMVFAASASPDIKETGPAATLHAQGKVAIRTCLGPAFRYTLTSDKLETFLAVESIETKERWQLRFGDDELKKFGPAGVELPRQVVVRLLQDALTRGMPPSPGVQQQLELHGDGEDTLALTLRLQFCPLFAPEFKLPLLKIEMTREDLLEAQVRDLKEELMGLREDVEALRLHLQHARPVNPTPIQRRQTAWGAPSPWVPPTPPASNIATPVHEQSC